jgi:hypothetical protein
VRKENIAMFSKKRESVVSSGLCQRYTSLN